VKKRKGFGSGEAKEMKSGARRKIEQGLKSKLI
jgi:hypothetical protein